MVVVLLGHDRTILFSLCVKTNGMLLLVGVGGGGGGDNDGDCHIFHYNFVIQRLMIEYNNTRFQMLKLIIC